MALDYKLIGDRLKKARVQKGYTQEKLSELLEANSKFIGHVERVERYISLKKLIALSKILDVPINKFFTNN